MMESRTPHIEALMESSSSKLRLIAATAVVGAVFLLSGCLSRQAGPTLPYIRPANSVPMNDPAAVHLASRVESMEAEMRRLRDMIERGQMAGADNGRLKGLQDRVAFIERQLGIERAERAATPPPVNPGQPQGQVWQRIPAAGRPPVAGLPPAGSPPPQGLPPAGSPAAGLPPGMSAPLPGVVDPERPVEIRNSPMTSEEQEYRRAHAAFRKGQTDQAIQDFENFLKQYPKSRFAGSAAYWIGEGLFAQGKFEEAVLQFDRVIKEFPGSNKEVSALLKQGQAFEKMGDARSARIIFEKIIKDYPHTAQARIAGARLKSLPPETSSRPAAQRSV
jgi:tol-pal system protein YbgF